MQLAGWIVLNDEGTVLRREVGQGWWARKKSTLYVSEGAAKAQARGAKVVPVWIKEE